MGSEGRKFATSVSPLIKGSPRAERRSCERASNATIYV